MRLSRPKNWWLAKAAKEPDDRTIAAGVGDDNMKIVRPALRALGVSRIAENEQAVLVSFSRRLTDGELRALHERLRQLAADPMPDYREALSDDDLRGKLQ